MNQELINKLKKLAEKRSDYDHLSDDDYLNPQDISGGNFDDCYNMGIDEGQTQLAREILDSLNINYTTPPKRK
jgi:hypothetical protein